MAKNMARIENGVVINIEWCSGAIAETDELKNLDDRVVVIGDTYEDGHFYRDGVEVLTYLEMLQAENADMAEALAILEVETDG